MAREKQPNTYGIRHRYRGKMVLPAKKGGKGAPRASTHGGKRQSKAGYECEFKGQPVDSKHLMGKFKVQMPRNRVKYIRPGGKGFYEQEHVLH